MATDEHPTTINPATAATTCCQPLSPVLSAATTTTITTSNHITRAVISILLLIILSVTLSAWGWYCSSLPPIISNVTLVSPSIHTGDVVLMDFFPPTNYGRNDSTTNINAQFVKPVRIDSSSAVPLHAHDLVFEQMQDDGRRTTTSRMDSTPVDASGGWPHFHSHTSNDWWEAQPEYVIRAFGHRIHLVLEANQRFVAPDLHVMHVWHDRSQRFRHDHRMASCFYTGTVKGDKQSKVAVSLCNGMTGYIRTSTDNYYIQPVRSLSFHQLTKPFIEREDASDHHGIWHRIERIPLPPTSHSVNSATEATPSHSDGEEHCDITSNSDMEEHSNIITDEDYTVPMAVQQRHHIRKRHLHFDYIDTETTPPNTPIVDYFMQTDGEIIMEAGDRAARDTNWLDPPPALPSHHQSQNDFGFKDSNVNDASNENFIKVLVVVDRTMVEYHRNREGGGGNNDEGHDLQHYILTLMSHVALLYKDASIGNAITVSVVNILILPDRDFTSPNSQVMLRKFCEWQQLHTGFGDGRSSSPPHIAHDTALLLTRNTICKNSSSVQMCNTLGVAEVGSMCNPSSSCAIVRDKGLSTSYTIAHELGHVLSMPHDDDRKCQVFLGGAKLNNIMSKMIQNDTKPWLWSKCSKHFVTEFLESSRAQCLRKPPGQNFITSQFAQMLPGETFEVDRQCELEFGTGSKICSFMPTCGPLWCTTEMGEQQEGCKTQYMPWAEGTKCGVRRWCHRGRCVALDRHQMAPVPGGWGDWQAWGECSRTCGGGVQLSRRSCDSPVPQNGGPYCSGKAVRYRSCNTHECDANGGGAEAIDFRAWQCSQFNGQAARRSATNVNGTADPVEWLPKYGFVDEPEKWCRLYCRSPLSNAYYLLKDKVIDGTKCGLNSFDICVNGICRKAGCDNVLDSTIELDDCGVCGGDNSQCREVKGVHNVSAQGYNFVVRIPKGSSNLIIKQHGYRDTSNDDNYLALVDGTTGEYLLNGNYVVSTHEKDVVFGALIISYSGASAISETIKTPRNQRLAKDLVVEVLSVGKIPPSNITYRYVISKDNAPRFAWRLNQTDWSECSNLCGGHQTLRPTCVEVATNAVQSDSSLCPDDWTRSRKPIKRECNTHCELLWRIKGRGPCSEPCGPGIRTVSYGCMKLDLNKADHPRPFRHNHQFVDDAYCQHQPKPQIQNETCEGKCTSVKWHYGRWSTCSKPCDGGVRQRIAKCVDSEGNREVPHEEYCVQKAGPKHVEEACNSDIPCDSGAIWSVDSVWSPCSNSCGPGVQFRTVNCRISTSAQSTTSDNMCASEPMPVRQQACVGSHACMMDLTAVRWSVMDAWSECRRGCNQAMGRRHRTVRCVHAHTETERPDGDCLRHAHHPKPATTESCHTTKTPLTEHNQPCPQSFISSSTTYMPARWTKGAWSECNTRCERHRQVVCSIHGRCQSDERPPTTEKCRLSECQQTHTIGRHYFDEHPLAKGKSSNRTSRRLQWKIGKWKQCSTNCGRGVRRRHVECEDTLNQITLVDQYCQHIKRPKSSKPCQRLNCSFVWLDGDWSECSAKCGPGTRRRNVTCHRVWPGAMLDPTPLTIPSPTTNHYSTATTAIRHRHTHRRSSSTTTGDYCDVYSKPVTREPCQRHSCGATYVWQAGPWRRCTATCGRRGKQARALWCVHTSSSRKVPKKHCAREKRPVRRRKCNQWACLYGSCKEVQQMERTKVNRDYLIRIQSGGGGSGASGTTDAYALVYCHRMDTNQPVEYVSLARQAVNYAEYYDQRLKDPSKCPNEGKRWEQCGTQCIPVTQTRAGLTVFWKIRINITTLTIEPNDFTFSSQTHGTRITYGTAADCYSTVPNCAQARFGIDLTGTSFRLAAGTQWRKWGPSAVDSISKSHDGRKVLGRCGGYCGGCEPTAPLRLEINTTRR